MIIRTTGLPDHKKATVPKQNVVTAQQQQAQHRPQTVVGRATRPCASKNCQKELMHISQNAAALAIHLNMQLQDTHARWPAHPTWGGLVWTEVQGATTLATRLHVLGRNASCPSRLRTQTEALSSTKTQRNPARVPDSSIASILVPFGDLL